MMILGQAEKIGTSDSIKVRYRNKEFRLFCPMNIKDFNFMVIWFFNPLISFSLDNLWIVAYSTYPFCSFIFSFLLLEIRNRSRNFASSNHFFTGIHPKTIGRINGASSKVGVCCFPSEANHPLNSKEPGTPVSGSLRR